MATLEIRDLHVSVDTDGGAREILRGVDLTVRQGETHAIMGPNGSGKSTLAYSVAGHPKYTVTSGTDMGTVLVTGWSIGMVISRVTVMTETSGAEMGTV